MIIWIQYGCDILTLRYLCINIYIYDICFFFEEKIMINYGNWGELYGFMVG